MRVCIGAGGRFHIIDLARQMERLGHLTRLYTGEPGFRFEKLPHERVSTYPLGMMVARVLARLNWRSVYDLANGAAIESFDNWMAENLDPCDVLHTLSSYGTKAHRAAREKFGALTVCERSSSHIVYQDEILGEEFARWGQSYCPINRRIVQRELEEYDQAGLVVAPSTFAVRSFLEKGVPAAKVRLAPFGVELGAYHAAPRRDNV